MTQWLAAADIDLLLLFNGGGPAWLDSAVVWFTHGATWIPLYATLAYLTYKKHGRSPAFLYALAGIGVAMILSAGVDNFIAKPLVGRPRPCHDPAVAALIDTVEGYYAQGYSFFSTHSSNTMAVAAYFSLLFRGRWALFLLPWSLMNGWTRLYLGVHYPSDVLVGFAWGALSGVAGYTAHLLMAGRKSGNRQQHTNEWTPRK